MVQLKIYHCPNCGNLIPDGRVDKTFCNRNCKQAFYRKTKRAKHLTQEVLHSVGYISSLIAEPRTEQIGIRLLLDIKREVTDLLKQYGVKDIK